MRHAPKPLGFEDIGRAARALARLPDSGGEARAALAWASVHFWRALNVDRAGDSFPLSVAVEVLCESATEGIERAGHARAGDVLRALAVVALALAREGDDPTGGATHFHHGSAAPDWALTQEPSRWIGRWAFYGGEARVAVPAQGE